MLGTKPCATLAPVRVRLDRRDGEHEQAEAAVAEHALEPLERQRPGDHERARSRASRISTRYGRPESSCSTIAMPPTSAAHVSRFTISEAISVPRPALKPDALAHEVEDGTLRDRRDAAAHLRVDDDPDDTDHDDPHQLEAERRAGLRVEDEVADVDEAADRRQDPERDLEELLHRRFPSRSALAAARASSEREPALRRAVGAGVREPVEVGGRCVEQGPRGVRRPAFAPWRGRPRDARAAFVSSAAWTRTNVEVERPRAASAASSAAFGRQRLEAVACCCRAFLPGAPCPPQPASSSAPGKRGSSSSGGRLRPVRRRARR